jgi:DNA helicase-2/ATP-dependent DNA helicase PcrA
MKASATKSAKETIKKYVERHKEDILNVQEVEARLEFPLEKATIAGRVDVIISPADKTHEVRDYKTADTVTSLDEASLQVQIYTMGLNVTKHKIDRATIAYLKHEKKTTDIIPVKISDTELDRAKNKSKNAIAGIKNGAFGPRSGTHCKNCDYKRICRYLSVNKK